MLKEGTIPIVDQPLIQAVKYALDQLGVNPDTLPKKKRRTCLDGVGNGGSSYNGYFTIKLRPLEDGTQKIVVCDGATYDAEKGTSGDSLAQVNNVTFQVACISLDVPEKNAMVYLVYHPAEQVEDEKIDAFVEVFCDDKYFDVEEAKYLLGECSLDSESNEVKIIQRHGTSATKYMSNGVAYIEYIIECTANA